MLEGKREGAAEGFSRGFCCCCRREVELWWGAVRVGAGRFNMCLRRLLRWPAFHRPPSASAAACVHRAFGARVAPASTTAPTPAPIPRLPPSLVPHATVYPVPSCAPCPSPVAVHTSPLLYFYFLSPHLHLSPPSPHYTPHYTHTTILHTLHTDRLQVDEPITTIPTIGFNVETLQYKNIKFQVWDLGGQTSIRPYWRCYYPNTDAIIYVVDR